MPLDKSGSKAAVGNNIAAEMGAGKPRKQAIAIALDVQREAEPGGPRRGPRKYKRTSKTRVDYE